MRLVGFDPKHCAFPKQRVSPVPARPVLSPPLSWFTGTTSPSRFRHYSRGRYALCEAYRLAGVGLKGALFAPAYHCVTMLDPALALGADIRLYSVKADLSPDLTRLDSLLSEYGRPVSALLATHYFGFAQDFRELKDWCDKHKIVLIEDCAHVLFTPNYQALGTGVFGKFVASSPAKFFSCEDGGLLYCPEEYLLKSTKTESPGLIQELRGVKRVIEKYWKYSTRVSDAPLIDEQLETLRQYHMVAAEESIGVYSRPSSLFSEKTNTTAALCSSRILVRFSSIDKNIRRRRRNYRRWLNAIAELPQCRALFPTLPENCAPYMFPLVIDHPNFHFYMLKHLGLPINRWDQMAVSACKIAQDYRLRLLHLPCHQTLTKNQMDWMLAVVKKALHLAPSTKTSLAISSNKLSELTAT